MEKRKLDLKPIAMVDDYGNEIPSFEIKDYDVCKEIVDDYCSNLLKTYDKLDSFEKYNELKDSRTQLRKRKEFISSGRKNLIESYVGTLEKQLMALEKQLEATDNTLKDLVHNYEETQLNKTKAPKKITIEVKTFDRDKANKILAYLKKFGDIEVKEK